MTTQKACLIDPLPKYDGPLPVFYVCEKNLCINELARVHWTQYYLALRNWAQDADKLCGEEL